MPYFSIRDFRNDVLRFQGRSKTEAMIAWNPGTVLGQGDAQEQADLASLALAIEVRKNCGPNPAPLKKCGRALTGDGDAI